MNTQRARLFESASIGELRLENRIAVAPMTRISAMADGCATNAMREYYEAFARGGFGMIISEGTYTDLAFSQGYRNQPGIATAAQAASWRPVVAAVHAAGGRFLSQIMHAGALSQHNPWREHTVGPSAVQPRGAQMGAFVGSGPYAMPREMTVADIDEAVKGFATAAQNAREAGFDGVEIHGANGYLLDQFLTSYTNQRTDKYGGATRNRILLTCEVVHAVRDRLGADAVVGVRISQAKVNDYEHRWEAAEEDASAVFGALRDAGASYIHTVQYQADAPAFDQGASLAALARRYSGLPVVATGSLHDPDLAASMIETGQAEIIAMARGALANADWPRQVLAGGVPREFDPGILSPLADLQSAKEFQRQRLQESQRPEQSVA